MDIRIRSVEGTEEQPFLQWDSVWKDAEFYADWVVGPLSDPLNPAGLQAKHAMHTAVILCLFTWRRAEDYETLPAGKDRKGWWGDVVDVDAGAGETSLGSKLWLLFRSPLNTELQTKAEQYALEALQPLIAQNAVSRIDVTSDIDVVKGVLVLYVKMYSEDGERVYDQKFARIWNQEHGI